jgi:hypothetical protein
MLLLVVLKTYLIFFRQNHTNHKQYIPLSNMFISNMFMDEILTLLFFLTNVTNKKGVKTCFMISNLSFGLANVFTHVAAKQ